MLRLKEIREERRLSQVGLAAILGISQSTISAYEVGERAPDFKALMAFADFFHVSLDYIAGLSDVRQPIRQSDLTADELELLCTFRHLCATDKEKIKSYIDGLQSRHDVKIP